MNFFRWLSFWPVAIISGTMTSGLIIFLGNLLFGHWWLTGCLVIAASALIQPIVATFLSVIIAPRINKFTAWSIMLPYLPLYLSGMVTIIALMFFGYEGYQIEGTLFEAVSPWWFSFSYSLGWIYGFCVTWEIWGDFQEQQKLFDEYVEAQRLEAIISPSGGAAEAA